VLSASPTEAALIVTGRRVRLGDMGEVVVVQPDIAWEDKAANYRAVADLLGDAARPGALVVLPEMFDVGFTMNATAAVDRDGATRRFLADLARRLGAHVLAGFATADGPGGRPVNQAVAFDPEGRPVARYVKAHPFNPGGEGEHYAAGDGQPVLFEWAGLRVATAICYDLRFPEQFRAATRAGAEAFAVVANWPAARVEHWVTLARARAIENQAYVFAVNRCGRDPKLPYPGRSLIVDPRGAVLAEAGDGPQVLTVTVDVEAVRRYRTELPFLRDMRPG